MAESKRPSRMIHRKTARQFLLDYAAKTRAHPFNRVAPEVYDQLEAGLREKCRQIVQRQPSKGKTIR